MSHQPNHVLLTIDVEDWFQVENFKHCIPFSSWPSRELRVEKNTHHILDLLDSIEIENTEYNNQKTENPGGIGTKKAFHGAGISKKSASDGRLLSPALGSAPDSNNSASGQRRIAIFPLRPEAEKTRRKSGKSSKSCLTKPKATFFVLGWIAERLPSLVREIHARGHEVASHGHYHNLCSECTIEALIADLTKSKKLLEDIIGAPVLGYRAPSFSINHDILQIIKDCSYLYDSSYNSFAMHSRYGHLDLSQNGRRGIAFEISKTLNPEPRTQNPEPKTFYELPISNLKFAHQVFPWGGGSYFRMIPFPFFRWGVNLILKREKAYLFYMHPWEIDPDQPMVKESSRFYKVRHYTNLKKTLPRLQSLIKSCQGASFFTCQQYLEESIALTTRVSKSQETQSS